MVIEIFRTFKTHTMILGIRNPIPKSNGNNHQRETETNGGFKSSFLRNMKLPQPLTFLTNHWRPEILLWALLKHLCHSPPWPLPMFSPISISLHNLVSEVSSCKQELECLQQQHSDCVPYEAHLAKSKEYCDMMEENSKLVAQFTPLQEECADFK